MSPTPCDHPTPDRLAAFGLGRLPDDEAAAVEEHLLRCEPCLLRLGDPAADPFVAALRGAAGLPAATRPDAAPDDPERPPPHPRYRLGELLGRGGMGEVYRAHEPSIGREVAVKVLRGRLRRDPAAAARFVGEARITGRLQHPGVPPVFEVGEWPGGGPFLSMKLIDGRTLAELLADGRDQPALLAAFEAVCQTIGYAHSRGVIHRDLKPGNVMVGAFGEVQVMDWGLAKEMRSAERGVRNPDPSQNGDPSSIPRSEFRTPHSSDTRPGAVLGTPGYLPPEQARGEPADARSDVFALGAILCEILTGRPPHADGSALERVRLAADGDLTAAFARLDGCGADTELVALAKRCLSPDRAARPADGKAVTDAVAAHRAGVEGRLRAAERERAAAEARAAEQRKRARVQLALAASVLLLAAGGGVAGWVVQSQVAERKLAEVGRRQQEERGRAAAEAALARLPELWERGLWAQAEAALVQAETALGPDGDADLRAAVADARANTAFVRRLDRVRSDAVTQVSGAGGAGRAARGAYRTAFADHGFDVLAGDPADLARRVRESPLRPHLLAALDDWALNGPTDRREMAHILAVTAAATGRAWRTRLPDAFGDPTRLAAVYAAVPIGERSPGLVYAVGLRLNTAGADGVRVLEAALDRHPGDFWLHHALGAIGGKERAVARIGANRAALALRPASAAALNNLALDLGVTGDTAGKIARLREASRLDPSFAQAHSNLGSALRDAGDLAAAEAAHREAVRLDPTHASIRSNLGIVLRDRGNLAGAADHLREAVRLDPNLAAGHLNLGTVHHARKDLSAAVACYREAVRLDPGLAVAHSNLGAAFLDGGEKAAAEASFRTAIRLDPHEAAAHTNLGKLLTERGESAAALACFREAVRLDPRLASAQTNLALTLLDHGDVAGAEAAARAAIAVDPKFALAHAALARVLGETGDSEGSIRALADAARLDPDNAGHHCNLGHALVHHGRFPEALAAMRRGHELGTAQGWSMPSAAWVGQCQHAVASGKRFEAFLAGGAKPADAAALSELAWVAARPVRKQYGLAYALFADTFAADPKLAASAGYFAAAAAVRLAAGDDPTSPVGEDEWVVLHARARQWFAATLAPLRAAAKSADPARRAAAVAQLKTWAGDSDWRPVRDPAWLAAMPAADRAAWAKLWADVADVCQPVGGK